MAISQRTATSGTAASGAGFTITAPTGSTAPDVLLLGVANAGTSGPAAPTGWTSLGTFSAGAGQSITIFWAPFSAGLTLTFTNASSVAAWVCNAFIGSDYGSVRDSPPVATSNTTNNTTLPTGAPTTGSVVGDYEVLFYAWTSAATISSVASGSTIDATQANSTTISASIGHNNTTSLGKNTTTTAFSQTLSASNALKTGVGVLLNVPIPSFQSTEVDLPIHSPDDPFFSATYVQILGPGYTFSFRGGPVQPGPPDGLPDQKHIVRAREPFWTSYSRKQTAPPQLGRVAFSVLAELTPFPFPMDGGAYEQVGVVSVPIKPWPRPLVTPWVVPYFVPQTTLAEYLPYTEVGVVPVPIVKTPPLVTAPFPLQVTQLPFPADGWAVCVVGVVPVPIVKTPLPQAAPYPLQSVPVPYPSDGFSISVRGVVPVPLVKTPPLVAAPYPLQVTPLPYPADGWSVNVRGIVPVPIVKTPPLVYAQESPPVPYPAPGSAWSAFIYVLSQVVVTPPSYMRPVQPPPTVPVPYPADGTAFSLVGVVPVPIVKTPLPVASPFPLQVTPYPYPADGWSMSLVGVVSVPIVKTPPGVLAQENAPPTYPFAGSAWTYVHSTFTNVSPAPYLLVRESVSPEFPFKGFSLSVVGVVPVPIVKTPPGVLARESVPFFFPEPGSTYSSAYYPLFVIIIAPATTNLKDVYTTGQSISGGQGGKAVQQLVVAAIGGTAIQQTNQVQGFLSQQSATGKGGGKSTQ